MNSECYLVIIFLIVADLAHVVYWADSCISKVEQCPSLPSKD